MTIYSLNDAIKIIQKAEVSRRIQVRPNNIGAEGAKDLAEQLKDSKVSHTIDLQLNNIGNQGAKDLAEQLKDSKVSHTIDLGHNYINAEGAKDLAEQLKDSKVSHTINLEDNIIGAQGASALKTMIKNSKFPSYIIWGGNELEGGNGIEETMQNNDAILAIQNPKAFEAKIKKVFNTSLPALASRDLPYLPEELNNIIIQHIGQQEINHMNLQYLQDLRIMVVKKDTGEEITPAIANYTIKDILTKDKLAKQHKLDIGRIDKVATLMLFTESAVNLLPKEVKKKVSEFVDIKYLQYGMEGLLGLEAAYLGYKSDMNEWNLPLKRAVGFYVKEAMVNGLVIHMESVKRMIDEYTYGYVGEKEQSLILEIAFGVGIGMLSPAPMMTIGVMSLGGVRNYWDIEEQSIGKIGGGVLGFAGAYYAEVGTYYQYAASIISAAYVGDMLAGIIDIAEYGIGFITNSEESKLHYPIEESHIDL